MKKVAMLAASHATNVRRPILAGCRVRFTQPTRSGLHSVDLARTKEALNRANLRPSDPPNNWQPGFQRARFRAGFQWVLHGRSQKRHCNLAVLPSDAAHRRSPLVVEAGLLSDRVYVVLRGRRAFIGTSSGRSASARA